MKSVNLSEKFDKFSDYWAPRVIAEMNDYYFKLVKVKGKFVWHTHDDTDETFIVLDGELIIEFRDKTITLKKGEMIVIPKGVEHKPAGREECQIMIVEPKGVMNTGDADDQLTAENDVWI